MHLSELRETKMTSIGPSSPEFKEYKEIIQFVQKLEGDINSDQLEKIERKAIQLLINLKTKEDLTHLEEIDHAFEEKISLIKPSITSPNLIILAERIKNLLDKDLITAFVDKLRSEMNIERFNAELATLKGKDKYFEVAKECAKKAPEKTVYFFKAFELTEPHQRFEIAKLCIEASDKTPELIIKHIEDLKLSKTNPNELKLLIEIAKLCALRNFKDTAKLIQNFEFNTKNPDELSALFEIAKIGTDKYSNTTASFIDNFNFDKTNIEQLEMLYELAKRCGKINGSETAEFIEKFGIDPNTSNGQSKLLEIATICASTPLNGPAEYLPNFGIENFSDGKNKLIQILKLCAKNDAQNTIEFLENYALDEETLFELAVICAKADPYITITHIREFQINEKSEVGKSKLIYLLKLASQYANEFFETTLGDRVLPKFPLLIYATIYLKNNLNVAHIETFYTHIYPEIVEFLKEKTSFIFDPSFLQNIDSKAKTIKKVCLAAVGTLLLENQLNLEIEQVDKLKLENKIHQKHLFQKKELHDATEDIQKLKSLIDQLNEIQSKLGYDHSDEVFLNLIQEASKTIDPSGKLANQNAEVIIKRLSKKIETLNKKVLDIHAQLSISEGLLNQLATKGYIDSEMPTLNTYNRIINYGNQEIALSLLKGIFESSSPKKFNQSLAKLTEIKKTSFKLEESPFYTFLLLPMVFPATWFEKINKDESKAALEDLSIIKKSLLFFSNLLKDSKSLIEQNWLLTCMCLDKEKNIQPAIKIKIAATIFLHLHQLINRTKQTSLDMRKEKNEAKQISLDKMGLIQLFFQSSRNLPELLTTQIIDLIFNSKISTLLKEHPLLDLPNIPEKDLSEKYLKNCTTSRFPNALLLYANRLQILNKDPLIKIAFNDIFLSILNQTFEKKRYKNQGEKTTPHIHLLATQFPETWEKWKSIKMMDQNIFENLDKSYLVELTGDWKDILLCGTEVLGSCQRIDGDPKLNKGLLGYLMGGQNKVLAIKDHQSTIIARTILRILITTNDQESAKPVLFFEKIYPTNSSDEIKNALHTAAKEIATKLDCKLFKEGVRGPLEIGCIGGPAPYEYVDGLSSIKKNQKFFLSNIEEIYSN